MDIIGAMVGLVKDFSGAARDFKLLYEKLNLKINQARSTMDNYSKTHSKMTLTAEYLSNRIKEGEAKKNELEEILKQAEDSGSISL